MKNKLFLLPLLLLTLVSCDDDSLPEFGFLGFDERHGMHDVFYESGGRDSKELHKYDFAYFDYETVEKSIRQNHRWKEFPCPTFIKEAIENAQYSLKMFHSLDLTINEETSVYYFKDWTFYESIEGRMRNYDLAFYDFEIHEFTYVVYQS